MSVILPLHRRSQPPIDDGYRLWIAILDTALRSAYDVAVGAALIENAFCQGRYDAVADGRKLAGVAQARRKGSVLIHGTILTGVDRTEYLWLVAAAERLLGISPNSGGYDPKRIVSLHELVGRDIPAHELADAISRAAAITPNDSQAVSEHVSSLELVRAHQIVERHLTGPRSTRSLPAELARCRTVRAPVAT